MQKKLKVLCLWVVEYEGKATYEHYNVFTALTKMGYDAKFYMLECLNETSLVDSIKVFRPDITLFKPYSDTLRPELIGHINNELGFKVICWNGDDDKYLKQSIKYAGKVECIATNFKPAIKEYERQGQKAVWFPYGANKDIFKNYKSKKVYDCSFIGAIRPTRVFYLDKLANAGLSILVKGAGWKNDGSTVVDIDEYVNIINKTKVNINISEDLMQNNELVTQIKGRDFEVPMAGGFLITKDSSQIREFYKPNKEIVVYKDFNELIDKCKYYVKHDSKRERIALAGRARAVKYHDYSVRLKTLFKEIL